MEKIVEVPQIQTVEDRAGASASDHGNRYASTDANANANASNGDDRTDANDYNGGTDANDDHGCPYDGVLSTNDNHGGTNDKFRNHNYGWWLRSFTNDFLSQLTMPQTIG